MRSAAGLFRTAAPPAAALLSLAASTLDSTLARGTAARCCLRNSDHNPPTSNTAVLPPATDACCQGTRHRLPDSIPPHSHTTSPLEAPPEATDVSDMATSQPLAPPGLSRTFYKRELPCPPAVAFSSEEGQEIFREALVAGTMQGFFRLIEQFRTQDEPAYCGLASVAMVLNALAIDPRRAWKGPWRFFHEQMLDCCHPLEKVRDEGITLEQAACLARCNGAKVDLHPHGAVTLETFREMVREAAAAADRHIIVSYTRRAFLQTGDGHFSPIGGYSPGRDMVLILDTARFKYPPHWVRLEELFGAMAAVDQVTCMPRGFMRLGLQPRLESVLFTLDVRHPAWSSAFEYADSGLAAAIAKAAAAAPGATAASVAAAVAAAAPEAAVRKFVAVRMAGNSCNGNGGVCTQTAAIDFFLHELRSLPLFRMIEEAVGVGGDAAEGNESITRMTAAYNGAGDGAAAAGVSTSAAELQGGGFVAEEDKILSSNAEAASSAEPAVAGPLLPERLTALLLLAGPGVWGDIGDEGLRREMQALVDVAGSHKIVASEVEYLADQFRELPAVRRAMQTEAVHCDVQAVQRGSREEGDGTADASSVRMAA